MVHHSRKGGRRVTEFQLFCRSRLGKHLPGLVCSLLFLLLTIFFPSSAWAKKEQKPEFGPPGKYWKKGSLEVRVFDVGKGDAILVRLPNGKNILIDTGYAKTAPALVKALMRLEIEKLDLVLLTHHDQDHVGGYPYLLQEFPVDSVIQSYDPRDKGRTINVIPGSRLIDEAGVVLTVLGPVKAASDENNDSLVVRLTYGKISMLFAGDALEDEQNDLLKHPGDLKADLLKVPHHGHYKGFSPRAFFEAVQPAYAVITCDEKGGEPPEGSVLRMLEQGNARVLRTDKLGTIRFLTQGESIEIFSGGDN